MTLDDANDDTADANLEARYYPLQNWRADVVCVGKLNDEAFELVEVVDYDTYGNALSRPAVSADFDHDGGVTGSDLSDFFTAHGNGDPEADADLSGGITNDDIGVFYAAWEAGIFGPSRGACAYSGVIAGYAGYVRDRFASDGDLYHVRHRVYDTRTGTWTKRDPLGYVDGMGLYQYCGSVVLVYADHAGLGKQKHGNGKAMATYEYEIVCQKWDPKLNKYVPVVLKASGYTRMTDLVARLERSKRNGCCIQSLMIDAHHSLGTEDNPYPHTYSTKGSECSDIVSDSDLLAALPPLCKDVEVTLNVCNGCKLARQIGDQNWGTGASIHCTDGTNTYWWRIGADPLSLGLLGQCIGRDETVEAPETDPTRDIRNPRDITWPGPDEAPETDPAGDEDETD